VHNTIILRIKNRTNPHPPLIILIDKKKMFTILKIQKKT